MFHLHRFRVFAAGFALILSLGVVCVGVSAATSATVSARLTSKSFTSARAGKVKLVYKFSSKSSRFAYVLSRKAGSRWSRVRSVSKRGSFRGSHTMTVKSVFGSKPITAGRYRLKLSSSANSVTLSFTVTPSSSAPPSTTPPAAIVPKAGNWVASSLTGSVGPITSIFFSVLPDQATETGFGFVYHYSNSSAIDHCNVSGTEASWITSPTSPIVGGQFQGPGPGVSAWSLSGSDASGTGNFAGTFDSATSAHGTADFSGSIRCGGQRISSGPTPFSWTATWQRAS